MPTRFYLHASGSQPAPTNPAFDAAWEQTGEATRLPMDVSAQLETPTTLGDSPVSVTIPITTTQDILNLQFTSRQVFQPVLLDTSILFSCVLRCWENAGTNNAFIAYVLRAVTADGGTFLGTLSSRLDNSGSEFPVHASEATRIISQVAISAVTLSQPWRLVLELGAHAQGPTASGSFRQRIGCSAATDFALTTALTTDLNPWMELSANLDAVRLNNYQDIRMGRG